MTSDDGGDPVRKALHVALLLITYAVATWACRDLAWSPPPLLTPSDATSLLAPLSPVAPADDRGPAPATVPRLQRGLGQPFAVPPAGASEVSSQGPAAGSWPGFLAKLRALDEGDIDKVRIIHLGDSELVADGTSGSLRRELAQRFGLGGLGFSLAMLPLPWYLREHWRHREGSGAEVFSYPFGKLASGMYGPGGVAFEATPGARAFVTLRHPVQAPCTVQFFYGVVPRGGEVELYADGFAFARIDTDRWRPGVGVFSKGFTDCPDELEVKTSRRYTRLYGWSVEYDRPGIIWSSLGVVAAQLPQLQHYDAKHLVEALDVLRPDLMVLTFGLNLAAARYPPPDSYREHIIGLLTAMRSGLPEAACLVTGPYPVGRAKDDGSVHPESISAEVVSGYQREAAERVGCVFLDRFHLSGGVTAARRWVAAHPKILTGDYHHLTIEGANRMGSAIAGVIMAAYDGRDIDAARRFALERRRGGD